MPPAPGADGLRHAALQASGLPARILAVLREAGCATLGDLCRPLPDAIRLDTGDRALLARVAAYACAACEGRPPPLNLVEWLALFLPPRLAEAVRQHYGLLATAAAPVPREAKLGDTGLKLGVTRERARQLLQLAFAALRQALPLHAAAPLYHAAQALLHAAGGVLDVPALGANRDPAWGGANPAGTFLFLAQLVPGRIVLYRDFFAEFSPAQIERVEKALRDRLAPARGLLPLAEIAAGLPKSARLPGVPSAAPLLRTLLRHLPGALATRDGRAGLAERDAPELLCEILAESGETPLRILVDVFNARVHPECRHGSGGIRRLLHRDPRVRRTAPGRYALPGGLQAGLPLPL